MGGGAQRRSWAWTGLLLCAGCLGTGRLLLPEGLEARSVEGTARRLDLTTFAWRGPPPFEGVRAERLLLTTTLSGGDRPFGSRPASHLAFELTFAKARRADVACRGVETIEHVTWRERRWVLPRVALDCVLQDAAGHPQGALHLTRAADGRSLGWVRLGDAEVQVRSTTRVHPPPSLEPWQVGRDTPSGYELAVGGVPVGALDITGTHSAWLDPSTTPEVREALLVAVTALSLGHERILGIVR